MREKVVIEGVEGLGEDGVRGGKRSWREYTFVGMQMDHFERRKATQILEANGKGSREDVIEV